MKRLGLEFFDAEGNVKSLAETSTMLQDKLGGLTKEENLAAAAHVAGTDGMRAMLAIMDAGPAKLDSFAAGLEKQGSAAEVAAKKQDNLAGKVEQFQGSVETLAIQVGTKAIPALTDVTVAATGFVNEMMAGDGAGGRFASILGRIAGTASGAAGAVKGFVSSSGGLAAVGAIVGGLAGRFIALQVAMGIGKITAFVGGIKAAGGAMTALSAVMRANPFGIVLTALGAVAGALGLMKLKSDGARVSAQQLNDAMRAQADAARELADHDIDVAQRRATAEQATVSLERAEVNLAKLRKGGKASALQIREAESDVRSARVQAERATRDLGRAEEDGARKREANTKQTKASTKEHRGRIATLREDIKTNDAAIRSLIGMGRGMDHNRPKIEALRKKQEELRKEIGRLEDKKVTVSVGVKLSTNANGKVLPAGDGLGQAVTSTIQHGFDSGALDAFPFMGGSANLMGADADLGPFASMGAGMGLSVSSGLRPGSITSSGNESYHGSGDAVDMAGPPSAMMRFFRTMRSLFGPRLRELIYTPGGVGIKDGQPHTFTGQVAADHFDHVHLAYTGLSGDGEGRKPGTGDGEGVIAAAAKAAGIDPAILWGVYGAESNFGQNTNNSSAGAQGPFQFMPATAKAMGVNPHNFRSAAFGAARYLAQYASRGVAGMLAAYNAGPAGNPNNAETRAYIPKVLALAKRWAGVDGTDATDSKGAPKGPASLGIRMGAAGVQGADAGLSPGSGASPLGSRGSLEEESSAADLAIEGSYGNPAGIERALTRKRTAISARAGKIRAALKEDDRYRRSHGRKGKRLGPKRRVELEAELAILIRDARDLDADLGAIHNGQMGEEYGGPGAADAGGADGGTVDAGPTPLDYINADLAKAGLTVGTDDDMAAATKLRDYWRGEFDKALTTADPRDDIEAASNLKSAMDALASIVEARGKSEEDARREHTAALQGVRDELKRSNDIAHAVQTTDSFQTTKFLADLISGHIVGHGVVPRSFTPGAGHEYTY